MSFKKKVVVVSGHSGAGKSTLIKHILQKFDTVKLSVSCTTRLPRLGEQDGKDYYFINKTKFKELIKNNEFIEYTECFGNYYGTLKSEIKRILDNGFVCILDIEFSGAYDVLVNGVLGPDVNCIGILIEAPCRNVLERRLIARGENPSNIDARTPDSNFSEDFLKIYTYKVVNNILSNAQQDIANIFNKIIE